MFAVTMFTITLYTIMMFAITTDLLTGTTNSTGEAIMCVAYEWGM